MPQNSLDILFLDLPYFILPYQMDFVKLNLCNAYLATNTLNASIMISLHKINTLALYYNKVVNKKYMGFIKPM